MKGKILKKILFSFFVFSVAASILTACISGNSSESSSMQSEKFSAFMESILSEESTASTESILSEETESVLSKESGSDNISVSESSEENNPLEYSEGLIYECSKDKSYYIVIGLGVCVDRDIVIPDRYNGLPVKEIAGDAFDGELTINSVVIPDSVTTIGIYAFWGCKNMTSLNIGDGVTTIGDRAFYECSSLTSVVIGDGLTTIGDRAFYECSSLTSVVIGDGVTTIGYSAFSYCSSLTSVLIPDSVKFIGVSAFAGCTSLMSIVIGDGVTTIDTSAFADCGDLTKVIIGSKVKNIGEGAFPGMGTNKIVCYKGNAEEWAQIEIEKNNPYLMWSTIYYYIENEADVPIDGGNYWHYDENGEPVVW